VYLSGVFPGLTSITDNEFTIFHTDLLGQFQGQVNFDWILYSDLFTEVYDFLVMKKTCLESCLIELFNIFLVNSIPTFLITSIR